MKLNKDLREFITLLNSTGVKDLLVGGHAALTGTRITRIYAGRATAPMTPRTWCKAFSHPYYPGRRSRMPRRRSGDCAHFFWPL